MQICVVIIKRFKFIYYYYQIKRFINSNKDLNLRAQLIQKFQEDYLDIVQDPFGNYAIQFAIDTFGNVECKKIINDICEEVLSLSLQKFSSNVVEKCMENCDNVRKFYFKIRKH